jgi:HEAT repeat protein
MEALKDPDIRVRAAAANGLAAIGPGAQAATRALVEALKTQNEEVHLAAAEALKKINPEAAKKAGIE